ncbi:transcription cofactor vestigial-like protein 1 isoform X2 [Heterocephalus glaber]|uniref:Transcription cofactor vestigial-like protein 1 isoform X2 n=1 Tax=Heterocephalus glaber TaxID=10181 RepID=A0AAX6RQZ1_HETGA|nr:transcription cofactor vestigial-like protein 1 isoform X2 [Heterocephalus glaber]
MEEMKKTDTQLPTSRQKPIKTEWNSRSVLFTYFQGDISSEVDEHFSRALSNIKRPQELSPSSQSEEVILKNGKKVYVSPSHGPVSPGIANERNQSPERRKDLFFY